MGLGSRGFSTGMISMGAATLASVAGVTHTGESYITKMSHVTSRVSSCHILHVSHVTCRHHPASTKANKDATLSPPGSQVLHIVLTFSDQYVKGKVCSL